MTNVKFSRRKHNLMTFTMIGGLGISLALASSALAQSVAVTDTTASKPAEAPQEVIVIGARDLAGVKQKKTSSAVFGLDQPLVDTPRSITEISDKLLSRYNIKSVYDFTAVAAGTYTGSYFGVPGSLNIRGTMADNYFNGFQGIANFANYPTPVDSSSSIEIVRGPSSPVYGAGQVGGFMNFIPKSGHGDTTKYVDKVEGTVTATVGSYNQKEATLDLSAPLNLGGNKGGLHFYGKLEDSDSFYIGMHPKSQIAQISYATDLGADWTLDTSYQYIHSKGYLKSIGWNRVTQSLIDTQMYTSGAPAATIVAPGAAFITTAQYFAKTYGNALLYYAPAYGVNVTPNQYTELDPSTVKQVKLSLRQTDIDPLLDLNEATTHTWYGGLSRHFGDDDLKIESFLNTLDSKNYQSYGFASKYASYVMEQRLSYHFTRNLGPVNLQTIGGLSYRYTFANDYGSLDDFALSEDRRDISVGATADDRFNDPFLSGPSYAWATHYKSQIDDAGAFLLSNAIWGPVGVTLGGRLDDYHVNSINLGSEVKGVYTRYKADQSPASYNASVDYKTPWATAYATYAQSKSLQTDQAGAIAPSLIPTGAYIGASKLKEIGIKSSQLGGRFYAALDAYDQVRSYLAAPPTGAVTVSAQRAKGVEAELRYLVTPSFGITATWTLQKIKQLPTAGSGTFLTIPGCLSNAGCTSTWAGYTFSNANLFPALANGYYLHSSPESNGSLFATYDSKGRWGLTGGATYSGATGGYLPGAIRIHPYVLAKAGAYIVEGPYRVDFNIDNLFNQVYFYAQYDTDANANVLPGIGREWHIKVSRNF